MRPVKQEELQEYLNSLLEKLDKQARESYLDRRFESVGDFGRIPVDELPFRSFIRELSPDLDAILKNSQAVVIGEPGSGKTVVTLEAAKRLANAASSSAVPVRASLRGYKGDLKELLRNSTAEHVLQADNLQRVYLLDGLDELPPDSVQAFKTDLDRLLYQDEHARLLLTSRQAFLANRPKLVPANCIVVRILPFSESDIRAYALSHRVNPDEFWAELNVQGLIEDAENPFVLSCLVEQYRDAGGLPPRKSDNVDFVITRLIESRPAISRTQQRRALRMIAIAMETCSRNELTLNEATRVLTSAMAQSEEEAQTILGELDQSILLRTSTGISFQLASYGEFLAAQELENQSMDRVRQLAFVDNEPNDSWMNAISYLAELNPDVRKYFSRRHPEWMVASSPAVFKDDEKDQIVRKILLNLDNTQQFLLRHPTLRARSLARFLTPTVRADLKENLNDEKPTRVASALLLLALAGDTSIVDVAMPMAIDRSRNDPLRLCALSSLVNVGDPQLVDTLIENLHETDPFHVNVLDCIGALTESGQLRRVLPLLLGTDTMLSAAFYHFRELRSRDAVIETLRMLITDPATLDQTRAESYLEPIIEALREYMDEEVEKLSADLIVSSENSKIELDHAGLARVFIESVKASGHAGRVALRALTRLVLEGTRPIHSNDTIGHLLDADAAHWLARNGPKDTVRQILYSVDDPQIQEILTPYAGGLDATQREVIQRQEEQMEQKRQTELERTRSLQQLIMLSDEIGKVLCAAHRLPEERWPNLEGPRIEWLSVDLSKALIQMNLRQCIVHTSEHGWTEPVYLRPALTLIRRYALRLPNDVPLVHAIRSWPEKVIVEYSNRIGFSEEARTEIERYLSDHDLAEDELCSFVQFIEEANYWSQGVPGNLKRIALDNTLPANIRTTAMRMLNREDIQDDIFVHLLEIENSAVQKQAFDILIKRQHRPTIERELNALAGNVPRLKSIEQKFPFQSELEWLGNVHSVWAANGLRKLRKITLENSLPYITGLVTETLARIVPQDVSRIVREQIQFSPTPWRSREQSSVIEYDRNARILAARNWPFDEVLAKLKGNTSMIALKVYTEGPTDLPVLRRLLQLVGEHELARTADSVGGWSNLLSKIDPDRWLDGCYEAVIVMDGDVGRHLRRRKKPFTNQAEKAKRKLRKYPITLHVLKRYGIENYFSRQACEAILLRDLSAYFPIPDHVPILKHFSERPSVTNRFIRWILRRRSSSFYQKKLNEQIAPLLQLEDIANTDLRSILDSISEQAEALNS